MTKHFVKPDFFGAESRRLFSLYRRPNESIDRHEGVLICDTSPHEMFRCHRSRNQLCIRLANQGFHTFCFDYFATGDSDGDCGQFDLDLWASDIVHAANHFREISAINHLSVVGIRLGAALAIKKASELGMSDFYLWDPILSGSSYLHILKKMHHDMLYHNPYVAPFPTAAAEVGQLLGFTHSRHFDCQLGNLEVTQTPIKVKNLRLILSRENPAADLFARINATNIEKIETKYITEDQKWDDWRYLDIQFGSSSIVKLLTEAICEATE